MIRSILIGFTVFGLLVALPAATHADKKSAKRHLDRAVEYFAYERYESAAREFEKAFMEDADPRTLFAWAQAERLAKNCVKATLLYQQFLATKPQQAAADAAAFGIQECKNMLDAAAAASSKPDSSKPDSSKPDSSKPDPSKPDSSKPDVPKEDTNGNDKNVGAPSGGVGARTSSATRGARDEPAGGSTGTSGQLLDEPAEPGPWYSDRTGALLTGGGGGLVVIGLGLYISARGLANTAPDEADDETEFNDIVNRAAFRRNLAVVAGLAGTAVVTLGVLRYKRLREMQHSSVLVTPTIGSESAGILVQGRF